MNEREELEALRRLAALESKAKGQAAPVKYDAAAGGSTLKFGPFDTSIPLSEDVNNFVTGAGQNLQGMLTGASQYLPGGATRDDVAEQRRLDTDLNKRKAATAGSLLSNVPLALLPGGATTRGVATIGTLQGASQPSTSTSETLLNMLMGGVSSVVGQRAGNRLSEFISGRSARPAVNATQQANVGPSQAGASANVITNPQASARTSQMVSVGDDVSAGLTDGQRAALIRGRQLGMRTTPGQETGSKVLQQLEAKLESQPASSGTFFDIKNNNQRTLNRTVAAEIGEKSDDLSSEVLDRAYRRMGAVFDSVADDVPRAVDPDAFLARLTKVEADNEGMLAESLVDNPLVKRYFNLAASGQPTGAQLNNLQSQIGKAANAKRMTDPATAQALREVQHLIMDDIGTGLAPGAAQAFKQARQQYRTWATVVDKPNILNASTGNVSGANLANTLQRTDRTGYALGRRDSDMYDAAHFAQAFKPLVGDSGTATRSPLNMLEFALSVPTNIATRAYTSTPSISLANGLSSVMNNGVAPNSMSPTAANALARLMGVGGSTAGIGATPLIFGNATQ
jgi:hypothetical protein